MYQRLFGVLGTFGRVSLLTLFYGQLEVLNRFFDVRLSMTRLSLLGDLKSRRTLPLTLYPSLYNHWLHAGQTRN